MTTAITTEDLTRIAERLDRAAELLRLRGPRALELARAERKANLRATTYEGTRTTTGPGDPTGGTAANTADADALFALRLNAAIGNIDTATANLTHILATIVPLPKPKLDPNTCPPGNCKSCFRDNGYLEPQDTHPDGRTRHVGECDWCHGFKRDHNRRPPLALLEKRHRGGRITTGDITRAFANEGTRAKGA